MIEMFRTLRVAAPPAALPGNLVIAHIHRLSEDM
jgi:hypothetical protein